MKKLIGALALAAMVATSAFAELSFGGWVRTLPTFVGSDGDTIKTSSLNASWGNPFWARLDASWVSDDGKAGLSFKMAADANGIGTHDDVGIWFKPIDQIQIFAGNTDNYGGFRGDLGFGSWNWLRPNNWYVEDEGLTFSNLTNAQSFALLITPVEGLKIGAVLPLATALQRADICFGNASVAAAYTIDGIGTIKAGFFGKYSINAATAATTAIAANSFYTVKDGVKTVAADFAAAAETVAKGDADSYGYTKDAIAAAAAADENKRYGTIEAAFDLTAVDKLFVTIGGAFTIADSDWWKAQKVEIKEGSWTLPQEQIKLALGASYGITEAFKLSANFAALFFNSDTQGDLDPMFQFGVGADYALNDTLGLCADVRMTLPNNEADPTLSFLAGLVGNVNSNASLGIGFQGVVGLGDKADKKGFPCVKQDKADSFAWAVPIKMELSF